MFQKLAEEAEEKIEDTDPPLFLRFINLLINDAIFLLDEAFDVSTRCLKSVDTMYIFFFYTSEFFNMKNVTIMLQLFNAKHEIHVYPIIALQQYMTQIKDKQAEKERGEWNTLEPQQRQENENSLRQITMLARYHNMMGNNTIHALEMITREIKSIFCHKSMVDRIAGMLNYFLLHLVCNSNNIVNFRCP